MYIFWEKCYKQVKTYRLKFVNDLTDGRLIGADGYSVANNGRLIHFYRVVESRTCNDGTKKLAQVNNVFTVSTANLLYIDYSEEQNEGS